MAKRIAAYAAVYNSRSANLGGFYERIASGAFDSVLRTKPNVVCLFNHDDNKLLGRTASGTLSLRVDSTGLAYRCDLPKTATGDEVGELVSRGDIQGSSFGFYVGEDDWNITASGETERTIRSFDGLTDVSPVTNPAYPGTTGTSAAVHIERSATKFALEDVERFRKIDAAIATASAHDENELLRWQLQTEITLMQAGIKPEEARRMSGRDAVKELRAVRRTFKIDGKPVTRAQFLAHAENRGVKNMEQRLKITAAGRAERIACSGQVKAI